MKNTLLCLGYGYSARALARRLVAQGWRVVGTIRSEDKADAVRADGVEPLLWPCDLEAALDGVSHVLSSIAPDAEGDPVLREGRAALEAARPKWVGYLSTTGVYGDHGGGWVDEETPTGPATERGKRRVLAEQEWLGVEGLPVHVFRLAGIYGPGRGPFAKLRRGVAQRIIKKDQIFSRIHVEDIASVLEASIARPDPGRVYNVCDDDPQPPEIVLEHAAEMLGMVPPPAVPFETAEMTPMARSFYADSKRVRNDRMKDELGVKLAYPTHMDGLRAILEVEGG